MASTGLSPIDGQPVSIGRAQLARYSFIVSTGGLERWIYGPLKRAKSLATVAWTAEGLAGLQRVSWSGDPSALDRVLPGHVGCAVASVGAEGMPLGLA
jgi:hypothetical protein